jgi:hypothetical protein
MPYVGMDSSQARSLGSLLAQAATRIDKVRSDVLAALNQADLASDLPARLAQVQDGVATLGAGVADKADQAERFTVDPQPVAMSLDSTAGEPAFGSEDAVPLAFDLSQTGFATGVPGLTTALPGLAIPTEPLFRTPLSPFPLADGARLSVSGQQVVKIAIIGDSFMSGEGADGYHRSGTYVLNPPSFYLDEFGNPHQMPATPSSIHQSTQAGAVQAVRLLQAEHPDATIRITYSADGHTETLQPLSGNGDGPIFDVHFVAESGATSKSILGLEPNRPDSPSQAQIEAARNADVVIVSTGGNDAKVAATLQSAVYKFSFDDGTEDIQQSINDLRSNTAHVPEVYQKVIDYASPSAQVLVLGYPNILTPLLADGRPDFLWPYTTTMTSNINDEELDLMTIFGATLNSTIADYVKAAEPAPAQSFTFIPQWGHWFREDTIGHPNSAVNDYSAVYFNESYHPNDRGQQLIAGALLQHLEVAVDHALGRPPTIATEPASHFFAMTAGAPTATWDDPALATDLIPASARPELAAPGLSVTDLVPPVLPSIVDLGFDPSTWSTSSFTDVDWNSIGLVDPDDTAALADLTPSFNLDWEPYGLADSFTSSADVFEMAGSWDGGADDVWSDAWSGSMETYDFGESVTIGEYL